MYKDVFRRRCLKHRHRGLCGTGSFRSALVALVVFLSGMAQTAHAVDIHYAGAIGQDFLPEPPRTAPASPGQTMPPRAEPQAGVPELPGLGARTAEKAAPMATWTKVLIGVAVVGAMAALSNKGGGGSGEATVTTDGSSNTGGASTPPPASAPPPVVAPTPPAPPAGGGGGRDRDDDKNKKK